ncbi:hypothetical protein LCGC14_2851840 [marine sediment metagenome]|uniref:Uncharacterized protein n=1 Tax=marine sediment metagenome TaxID=412755 RepID=A0A0F9AZ32_9ZZZZ
MAQQPESLVRIREFGGLVSHRGDLIGRPGDALVQINMHSPAPGKLIVRKGRQALSYGTVPGGSGNLLSMYHMQNPDTTRLFMFNGAGQIVVGVTPS